MKFNYIFILNSVLSVAITPGVSQSTTVELTSLTTASSVSQSTTVELTSLTTTSLVSQSTTTSLASQSTTTSLASQSTTVELTSLTTTSLASQSTTVELTGLATTSLGSQSTTVELASLTETGALLIQATILGNSTNSTNSVNSINSTNSVNSINSANSVNSINSTNSVNSINSVNGINEVSEVSEVPETQQNNTILVLQESNFCTISGLGNVISNGTQQQNITCSLTVQGTIPSIDNMVSTIIFEPQNGANIPIGTNFNVSITSTGIEYGFFDDPATLYYTSPQTLNLQGIIQGHTHITIQKLTNSFSPPSSQGTTFFKGLNNVASIGGSLTTEVDGDLFLSDGIGEYRICTITASRSHAPVLLPVARRGSADDCIRINVF